MQYKYDQLDQVQETNTGTKISEVLAFMKTRAVITLVQFSFS